MYSCVTDKTAVQHHVSIVARVSSTGYHVSTCKMFAMLRDMEAFLVNTYKLVTCYSVWLSSGGFSWLWYGTIDRVVDVDHKGTYGMCRSMISCTTSLLSFQRYAMMWVFSHHYNPLLATNVEDDSRLDVAANGFWGGCHQRVFWMLRCLILIVLLPYRHHFNCIADWRGRSKRNMSSVFVKWRWDVLLLWCFPLLEGCPLFVTSFSRD